MKWFTCTTLSGKKQNLFAAKFVNGNNNIRVIVWDGYGYPGLSITQEAAREKYKVLEPVSAEKSKELTRSYEFEINR